MRKPSVTSMVFSAGKFSCGACSCACERYSARYRIPKIDSMCYKPPGLYIPACSDSITRRMRLEAECARRRARKSSCHSSRVKLDSLLDDFLDVRYARRRGDASEINIVSKVCLNGTRQNISDTTS